MPFILILLIALYAYKSNQYNKSGFHQKTKKTYIQVLLNKGRHGEYKLYRSLMKLDIDKKIILNAYLPVNDDNNTEIDLIMVCSKGIFVFENKNYSGWIYGDANKKQWTQTFKSGRKFKFLNPIWQNKLHCKAVQTQIEELEANTLHSIIVFGNQCELKTKIVTEDALICQLMYLSIKFKKKLKEMPDVFNQQQVDKYYYELLKFTTLTDEGVSKHREYVKQRSV